jgi:hypothetical protein
MQPIETSQKKYPSTCFIIKKEKDDNQNMIGNRCGVISTHQRELGNGLPVVARPTSAAKEKNQGNEEGIEVRVEWRLLKRILEDKNLPLILECGGTTPLSSGPSADGSRQARR